MFYQKHIKLNSRVLVDSIKTSKTVTIYLTVILNYHYIINLDKVATD